VAGAGVHQPGELAQHLRHLVAALAAPDIDHDVGLGVLRQGLLDDGLARAEAARHCHRAPLSGGEEQVKDTLPRHQRPIVREASPDWPWAAHGPVMRQVKGGAILQFPDDVGHREGAALEARDATVHPRRHQDTVFQRAAFAYRAKHITLVHVDTRAQPGPEFPVCGWVKRGGARARLNEVAGQLGQAVEGPADAVENRSQQARAQCEGECPPAALYRLADLEARGLLIDLKRRHVVPHADHFAEQAAMPDAHDFVQRGFSQGLRLRERAGNAGEHRAGHPSFTRYPIACRSRSAMNASGPDAAGSHDGPGKGTTMGSGRRASSWRTSSVSASKMPASTSKTPSPGSSSSAATCRAPSAWLEASVVLSPASWKPEATAGRARTRTA
jgi:hypothetical protein